MNLPIVAATSRNAIMPFSSFELTIGIDQQAINLKNVTIVLALNSPKSPFNCVITNAKGILWSNPGNGKSTIHV